MALSSLSPFWSNLSNVPAFWESTAKLSMLATASQTDGQLSFFHRACNAGCVYAPNSQTSDRAFYILAGNATLNVDGLDHNTQVSAGDFVAIPRFTSASYIAANDTAILEIYTPGGSEALVSGLWQQAFPGQSKPIEQAHPPVTFFNQLASQYGVEFFPTPSTASPASPTNQAAIAAVADSTKPYIMSATVAPAFWLQPRLPELWIMLAGSPQTGNVYTLAQRTFAKGMVITPSRHTQSDESYYVLNGTAVMLLDSEQVTVDKDQFVFVPRGTLFALKTTSDDFTVLAFNAPSGVLERSLSLFNAVPAKERRLPTADETTPPNITDSKWATQLKILTGIVSVNATDISSFQ